MTEYWKSNPKHYCKLCKCWTQGDKISIAQHEGRPRHQHLLQKFIDNSGKRKYFKERDERNLQSQLDQINRAAAQQTGSHFISTRGSGPQRNFSNSADHQQSNRKRPYPGSPATSDVPKVEEEDDNDEYFVGEDEVFGQYTSGSLVYLQAKWHQDLLQVGRSCQFLGPDEDDWKEGTIGPPISSQLGQPIMYSVSATDGGGTVTVEVEDIRFPAPTPPDGPPPAQVAPIGLGQWQTVSVQEESSIQHNTEDNSNVKQENGPAILNQRADEASMLSQHDDNDTYDVLNPFGGTYKGYNVNHGEELGTVAQDNGDASATHNTSNGVARFKKRKSKAKLAVRKYEKVE